MPITMSTISEMYKTMYASDFVNLKFDNYPLLAMLPRDDKWTGITFTQPIQYANNQGRSATFVNAQNQVSGNKFKAFTLTSARNYGIFSIDGEAIRASGGVGSMGPAEAGAFIEALKAESDSTRDGLLTSLAVNLYGDTLFLRGQRASISTNTVTLTNPHDGIKFDVGMTVGAVASDKTTLRTGTTTVTAVDRGATTTTVTLASAAAITSFANNDYLFVNGDYGAGLAGLESWIPSSSPTSTAFFGVDRSVDPTKLGGCRYSGTEPIKERLIRGEAFCRLQGGKISAIFMHPIRAAELKQALGDLVRYTEVKSSDGRVSFEGVSLATQSGPVPVIEDPYCQLTTAWGLQLDTWKIRSRGMMPGPLDHGLGTGGTLLESTADALQGRLGYYAQLACKAPGYNVRIDLS